MRSRSRRRPFDPGWWPVLGYGVLIVVIGAIMLAYWRSLPTARQACGDAGVQNVASGYRGELDALCKDGSTHAIKRG